MRTSVAALRVEEFERQGFTIFRNVVPPELITEARHHIEWLTRKYPDFPQEHLHHPLMRDDAFWIRLISDQRLLDIVHLFLGTDIACFTSHYICKPPNTGQSVLWHQDGSYWKLDSVKDAITLWLAVDESSEENGCLKMVNGTHALPLQPLILRNDTPNMLYSSISEEIFQNSESTSLILNPGDVSVHNPFIVHGSGPNTSPKRRCGLDIGYMKSSTRISNEGLYLNPFLITGKPVEGINSYRVWPKFTIETSIPFEGDMEWNKYVEEKNLPEFDTNCDEDVRDITKRMIKRLQEGTVVSFSSV